MRSHAQLVYLKGVSAVIHARCSLTAFDGVHTHWLTKVRQTVHAASYIEDSAYNMTASQSSYLEKHTRYS